MHAITVYHTVLRRTKPRLKISSLLAASRSFSTIFDFTVKDIDGNDVSMVKYKDKVTYIVNVASQWGFTKKNYAQLMELNSHYYEKGRRILAFPCNQFGGQEPGSNEKIKNFTQQQGVKFEMFSKIDANGANAHPLFKFLQTQQPGTLTDAINGILQNFFVIKMVFLLKDMLQQRIHLIVLKILRKNWR